MSRAHHNNKESISLVSKDPGIFQFETTEMKVSEDSVAATVVIENTGNTAVSATVR